VQVDDLRMTVAPPTIPSPNRRISQALITLTVEIYI